jgi:hypothetical protein
MGQWKINGNEWVVEQYSFFYQIWVFVVKHLSLASIVLSTEHIVIHDNAHGLHKIYIPILQTDKETDHVN